MKMTKAPNPPTTMIPAPTASTTRTTSEMAWSYSIACHATKRERRPCCCGTRSCSYGSSCLAPVRAEDALRCTDLSVTSCCDRLPLLKSIGQSRPLGAVVTVAGVLDDPFTVGRVVVRPTHDGDRKAP